MRRRQHSSLVCGRDEKERGGGSYLFTRTFATQCLSRLFTLSEFRISSVTGQMSRLISMPVEGCSSSQPHSSPSWSSPVGCRGEILVDVERFVKLVDGLYNRLTAVRTLAARSWGETFQSVSSG